MHLAGNGALVCSVGDLLSSDSMLSVMRGSDAVTSDVSVLTVGGVAYW